MSTTENEKKERATSSKKAGGEISGIKKVVAMGIGAAIYIVASRFAAIPTPIPNTTIQITYAILALISFIYGPVVGFGVGFIGHTISDMTAYGSPWFSWIFVSGFFGYTMGILGKIVGLDNFNSVKIVKSIVGEIIICAIGWGVIAPLLDILFYNEPKNKVFTQGIMAGAANFISVAVLGTILIFAYSKTLVNKGSLKKED